MSPELYEEVKSTLHKAGRDDLARRLKSEVKSSKDLKVSEAASILGVSSPNTIKNWLKGGMFPAAYRTAGGHWRFPREEVEAAKSRMDELRAKNARDDLAPPDVDDVQDPPLF